uniref:Rho-GAP domain-containing protein n=1 Tax=Paramoeba aestuarina TaxID=180227 RepID=A0A7S4UR61_9EUKA
MGDFSGSHSSRQSVPPSVFSSLSASGGFNPEASTSKQSYNSGQPIRQTVPSMPPTSPHDYSIRPDQEILMDLVKICFKGMGIPDDKIKVLEYQTKEQASLHEFFDPPLVKQTLEDVQQSLDPGFAKLKDLRLRWFTANCLRGYICRTRYAQYKQDFLPAYPGGPTPPLGIRLHYIKEMIKNETAFRDRLYFTFNKLERHLKDISESSDPWLSKADWKQVFKESASFRTIFGRHLKKFEKVYTQDWPGLDWGDICATIVKDFEDNANKFHGLAIKHQEISNVLEGMVQRPEFQTFFATISSDRKSHQYLQGKLHGLHALIFDPLTRVGYYEEVFKKILGLTSRTRKEHRIIEDGLVKLTRMLARFEEEKIQSKENVRLALVATKFDSVSGLDRSVFEFLPSLERGFMFEFEVTVLTHDAEKDKWRYHQGRLMVFNDVIVVSSENKGFLLMEENGCMLMCQVTVQDSFDISDPKHPPETCFKVTHEPKKDTKFEFIMATKTPQEKKAFINRVTPLVKENQLCFSRPLQDVVNENGSELPNIVHVALHTLVQKNAQTKEGIFRIAGEYKYLAQMKAFFDRWRPDHEYVDLSKYDSFDIASLLKQWFRELPEPVLTYAIYDKYVASDDDVNFEEFLEDLPPLNRKVVLAVMGFNVELQKLSETNMMTPANIAICWGPTILRPLIEDMNSSMRIPRVNKIVEDLVKWCAANPDRIPALPPLPQNRPGLSRAGSKDNQHIPSFSSCRPSSGTSTVIRMGSTQNRRGKMNSGLRAFSMMGISPREVMGEAPKPPNTPASPSVSPRSGTVTGASSPHHSPHRYPSVSPSSSAPSGPAPSAVSSAPSRAPAPSPPSASPRPGSGGASPRPSAANRPPPPANRPPPPPTGASRGGGRGTAPTGGRPGLPPPIAALPPPVPGGQLFKPPPHFVPPPAPVAAPILPPSPSCPASLHQQAEDQVEE